MNTLVQMARDSWGLLPLLLLVFILGVAVIIERSGFFLKRVRPGLSLAEDLQQVAPGELEKLKQVASHYDGTVQGALVAATLPLQGRSEQALEREVEEQIMISLPRLDRHLWLLDTCVTLGPLLGLLGTIVHLIEAFAVLSRQQGQAMGSVTAPIAQALVATAAGLVVAVVCVVALNFFNKRIRLLVNQLDLIKSQLIGRLASG